MEDDTAYEHELLAANVATTVSKAKRNAAAVALAKILGTMHSGHVPELIFGDVEGPMGPDEAMSLLERFLGGPEKATLPTQALRAAMLVEAVASAAARKSLSRASPDPAPPEAAAPRIRPQRAAAVAARTVIAEAVAPNVGEPPAEAPKKAGRPKQLPPPPSESTTSEEEDARSTTSSNTTATAAQTVGEALPSFRHPEVLEDAAKWEAAFEANEGLTELTRALTRMFVDTLTPASFQRELNEMLCEALTALHGDGLVAGTQALIDLLQRTVIYETLGREGAATYWSEVRGMTRSTRYTKALREARKAAKLAGGRGTGGTSNRGGNKKYTPVATSTPSQGRGSGRGASGGLFLPQADFNRLDEQERKVFKAIKAKMGH